MTKVNNVESNGLKSLVTENFSTREELLDRVRKVGLMEGYVTTIRRSKVGRYVLIGCDRGGKYRARGTIVSLDERKKISASRLIDCPFQIKGTKKVGESWKVEIINASHNHGLSSDMSGHPYCRRFSQEDMLSIRQMTLAGIPPRQILSSLRLSDPSCKAIARTVYNAKNAITKEVLAGRTMVQALFDELGKGDFSFDVERDGDGHLTHLFFAHPSSIVLTKSYPYVFAMDCTYKTNKYKMPLLDIRRTSFMGLPCAHMMRDKKDGTLLLDDIHPQWRIDRSFIHMDGGVDTNGSEIESLLKRFHDTYKQMPLAQKEDSHKRIAELVDGEIPLTLEPNIQPHKGRPLGSKKRKGDSTTTRHPSAFEIAEKTRKCSVCHRVGHNSRTCPHKDKSSSSDPHFVLANQDVSLNMLETPSQYEINTSLQL